jgi:hypothetical protein
MATDYYSLLTDISQRLSSGDIGNLVFSCGHIIPKSVAKTVTTGIHLFQELKQRGHLGPDNYEFLRKHLLLVGRHDLASKLPDQTEVLFGRTSVRDKGYFGCCVSPILPDEISEINSSVLRFSNPKNESRVLLLHLCEQLGAEDVEKVAFLMFPSNYHSCHTAMDLAKLIEEQGGLKSIDTIICLSSSLDATGRADLGDLLNSLKVAQTLLPLNSLSSSHQQLNLKMNLFINSKLRSYDFHMRALTEVETDDKVRAKLLSPLAKKAKNFFDPQTISSFAEGIKAALQNSLVSSNYDSLIRTAILEATKANQLYVRRLAVLDESKAPCLDMVCSLREDGYESYKSFNCAMDMLDWNSAIRREFEEDIKRRKSPFGTPGVLACQYIVELCKEISQFSDDFFQETDQHLLALNSDYFCCCYHVITLQWLASLLCLSSSSDGTLLDLSKYRDLLSHIVDQKKEEITKQYSQIADIVGLGTLQQLVKQTPSAEICTSDAQQSQNPFLLLFNVLTIKLLAMATSGPDRLTMRNVELSFMQMGQTFCNEVVGVASNMIRVSAAAMKKEVEAFRKKVLAEDQLCSRVIAALTIDSS